MAYLNLDLDYFEHPKVKRLVGLLGKGSEVLSIRLWCYCGKYHKEDGRLTGYSTQEIESIAGWWGKPGEMVDAMVKVKVIDVIGGEYQMHDWEDHEGHLPALSARAKAAAKKRWSELKGEEIPKSEKKETGVSSVDASSNATSIATSNAASNAKTMLKQCSYPSLPSDPSKPRTEAVAANESLPVHVQQILDPEKAPLSLSPGESVKISEQQFSKKDGSSLEMYLIHSWGVEARKLGWDIRTQMISLGIKFGWEKLYYAIDQAAKYEKKNLAYIESICDPDVAARNRNRKDKSWEENFANGTI